MRYPADFTPELRRKPICGVLAVAMIAGVSFQRATEAIKKHLPAHRTRHGGKTYHAQRCNALREFGVQFFEIALPRRMNLRTCIRNYCEVGKTYMITTTSHIVTVKNGIVYDQYEASPIDSHKSRRCFVNNILVISDV